MILSLLRKIRFGFLEKPLSQLCHKHSHFVALHPWPFIIVPIIITTAFGVGYFFKIDNLTVYQLYTPSDGLGLTERETFRQLFPNVDGTYTPSRSIAWDGECDLLVAAKDGGNILREEYRKAVIRLNDYVINQIVVRIDGVDYGYQNICLKFLQFCHINPQIHAVDYMMTSPEPSDNFSYPLTTRGLRSFYVGNTLSRVRTDPLSHQIIEAEAWQLVYQLNFDSVYRTVGEMWQRKFEKEMLAYSDDKLDISVYHSQSLDLELRRNGETLVPRFIGCIIALITFATSCSMSVIWYRRIPYIDWAKSKPTVAVAGLVGALMGVVTTVGLMRYCGVQYNAVVDAMPFVVMGVRLDNTFLMISAVHHTKRTLHYVDRIAEAMSEAAVSITLTVLTDILSFAVGIFTDFYAVQLFSIYICIAMTITFVYQLTYLLGILVLSVRAEERNAHAIVTNFITVPTAQIEESSLAKRVFCLGSHIEVNENPNARRPSFVRSQSGNDKITYEEGTWISQMIRKHYAPFLMKNSTRFAVLFIYLGYLAISIYGCCILRQGLEPSKLLVEDSYARKYSKDIEKYFWSQGVQSQIVFQNVESLANNDTRHKIFSIIDRFAYSKHGMGDEAVVFWLKSLQRFLSMQGQSLNGLNERTFIDKVKYFLSMEENAEFRNDIHWSRNTSATVNDSSNEITAFRVLVGMKNFSSALEQIETVDQFRQIASEYPEYNIYTFQIMWMFVDQYEEVLPNTLQEIYGGVSFMILIAVFLIPSVMCSLWVVLAILSIDAGTIGLMTFWDINLDVISMITIILSIGFSVDFTAHIAYSYVMMDGTSNVDRTTKALGSLAWPIVQGGISTMMGVVVLAGSNSYILVAFFRTVFLVISIGLLHALVFLPVVLSVFSCKLSRKLCCQTCKKNSGDKIIPASEHRNYAFNDTCELPELPPEIDGNSNAAGRMVSQGNTDSSNIESVPEDPETREELQYNEFVTRPLPIHV